MVLTFLCETLSGYKGLCKDMGVVYTVSTVHFTPDVNLTHPC